MLVALPAPSQGAVRAPLMLLAGKGLPFSPLAHLQDVHCEDFREAYVHEIQLISCFSWLQGGGGGEMEGESSWVQLSKIWIRFV